MCKETGCEKKYYGNGWCEMHYKRWKRHGDPNFTKYSKNQPGTIEYFKENITLIECEKVEKYPEIDNTFCHIWSRCTSRFGHGLTKKDSSGTPLVHVQTFKLYGGTLTKEKPLVLHKCNVHACCNPEHLYSGDKADNYWDMVDSGRVSDSFNH